MSTHATPGDAERVGRVYLAQRALGCDVTRHDGLTRVRSDPTPLIYDANFAFDDITRRSLASANTEPAPAATPPPCAPTCASWRVATTPTPSPHRST